ncbi:hypothetical protein PIB30_081046 [Stylosanthes scabra]|uniref:Uncharacterized protein n=1 Tax=Stylosanthes scabra TaxID=79078 RepID=A0ABU6QSV3_9FABA|nr:hypothetical protein [Stylosanthes scabra]
MEGEELLPACFRQSGSKFTWLTLILRHCLFYIGSAIEEIVEEAIVDEKFEPHNFFFFEAKLFMRRQPRTGKRRWLLS